MSSRVSYGIALLLLFLAAALRMVSLADLPAGLTPREQQTIRLMETARRGTITILFEEAPGRGVEMLGPTALAVTTVFTGAGPFALRWTFVLASLVMLTLVYTLAVRLFGVLAGLAALALLALSFWPTLLARSILIDGLVPLLVVVVMLALARAVPVYRIAREETATTAAFATFGAALGVAFYLHPVGLLAALGAMIFIVYVVLSRRPFDRQRLSYIGFSVLLVIIVSVPYLIFSINRLGLNAASHLIGGLNDVGGSVLNSLAALVATGDQNPAHNLPGRPLFDPITALLIVAGMGALVWFRRHARYVLVLVFLLAMMPVALISEGAPNYSDMAAWMVPLALCFGAATHLLLTRSSQRLRPVLAAGLVALGGFNLICTARDLLTVWPTLEPVRQAYESDLHQLARFLDREMGTIPTVICYPQVSGVGGGRTLNATQRLILMTNRRPLVGVRFVDCNTGLIFPRGGELFNVLLVEPDALDTAPGYLREWLALGTPRTDPNLPTGRVLRMEVGPALADRLGVFTTTVAARYGEIAQLEPPVNPPIRFGGNVTWLGNEPDTNRRYRPGDVLTVINYWRVESGVVPADLQFFTHVLSDPVTVADNRDMISVDVSYLRERDVFVQVVPISLRTTLLPGTYLVSIGAYQQQTGARLPVFDAEQQRQGDRLILYSVEIGG
ncbi:MAG: glycosyltransferase family 39 protein [Aggregatilineales bacterium]